MSEALRSRRCAKCGAAFVSVVPVDTCQNCQPVEVTEKPARKERANGGKREADPAA